MVSDQYMGQEAIIPILHKQALQALNITKNQTNKQTKIKEYLCFCNQFPVLKNPLRWEYQ